MQPDINNLEIISCWLSEIESEGIYGSFMCYSVIVIHNFRWSDILGEFP